MNSENASGSLERPSESEESIYLNNAEMAVRLEVSASTVARYRSEFAAYLISFAPPGGGRGLKPEAVEALKIIKEMKSRRASWIEIKKALEDKFGSEEADTDILGTKTFRRSLEAIRQTQQVMASELHLLLREINRRLDRLEKDERLLRRSIKSEKQELRKTRKKDEATQAGTLFPEEGSSEEPEA